ncbi:MAG TPA: DUF1080 domain-containing protein [Gemmatimonadaceae bacterium]|nr:DUF1080 domain-containing protein [Gemmatimonadaceae bacterium]
MGPLRIGLVAAAVFVAACAHNPAPSPMVSTTNGWEILDNLDAWRGYESETVPRGWTVTNNIISKQRGAGELMTKKQYGNFELALDWKISPGGNSGIFYRGTTEYDHIYWSAPEYQLEDNIGAEDNKSPDRWTAADYALYPPSSGKIPTADRWNTTRIIVNGAHVEHWLNGKKVVEYELWSPEWTRKVAASKFHAYPNYGMAKRGYIAIQGDHPGGLSLRNIRIRELP